MKVALRKAVRSIPGYQLIRHRYRRLTDVDFRNREELQRWVSHGMRLQERLHLEPFVFERGKAYVESPDGLAYWWNPEVNGGTFDLEFGYEFEALERDCVLSYLASREDQETVFLDIGSNCGLYSLAVVKRFPKSHAYCFEPVPATQKVLLTNAEHNDLAERITLVRAALGDCLGFVRMTASYSAMDHIVTGDVNKELSPLIVNVPMITLDSFASEHSLTRVDFIKCDVEGAELLVFKGGQELLRRFQPPMLVEIEPRHTKRFGYKPADLDHYLGTFGYVAWLPSRDNHPQRLPNIQEGIERGHNNFLYLPQDVIVL